MERQAYAQTQLPPISSNSTPAIRNIYRFPAFIDAAVVLQNGDTSAGRFNFSVSWNQMHFIGEKKDTFYVTDPYAIKFIQLDTSRFYYDKDYYLQTLFMNNEIVLAFRQAFIIYSPRASVSYAMPSSLNNTSATNKDNFNYYATDGRKLSLAKESPPLGSQEVYYFGDRYGNFFNANKRFIFDHYPSHQREIKSFIKINKISFSKSADMIKLLQYCSSFSQR